MGVGVAATRAGEVALGAAPTGSETRERSRAQKAAARENIPFNLTNAVAFAEI